jgi:hypothetical protein
MKYCYAPRRQAAFPDVFETWTAMPDQHTDAFLKRVSDTGNDGLEIGAVTFDASGSNSSVIDFANRLRNSGTPLWWCEQVARCWNPGPLPSIAMY